MSARRHALRDFTPQRFLAEYWQKRPLLIPDALPDFGNPLSPDELAGLACEDFIESRLICGPEIKGNWQLEFGPFSEESFQELPESHWTLHVQGVEMVARDAYRLFDFFRFMPNWRLEDIMVSYAPDRGSAGPHFDQYDVFLLQTRGKKRWLLGEPCDQQTPLLQSAAGLQLLEHFEPTEEFVAGPGDLLYIPPGISHYGIAEGESITYSIGFRAPTVAELCLGFAQEVTESHSGAEHYRDADLSLPSQPGLLAKDVVARMRNMVLSAVGATHYQQWLGKFITQPKQDLLLLDDAIPVQDQLSLDAFRARLAEQRQLLWRLGSRFCYCETGDSLLLFVNGELYEFDLADLGLIQTITLRTEIDAAAIDSADSRAVQILYTLYRQSWLEIA